MIFIEQQVTWSIHKKSVKSKKPQTKYKQFLKKPFANGHISPVMFHCAVLTHFKGYIFLWELLNGQSKLKKKALQHI